VPFTGHQPLMSIRMNILAFLLLLVLGADFCALPGMTSVLEGQSHVLCLLDDDLEDGDDEVLHGPPVCKLADWEHTSDITSPVVVRMVVMAREAAITGMIVGERTHRRFCVERC
jgi:hypothetical protein